MTTNYELSNEQKQNLRLSYCCINTVLRKSDIFTSRTCRLATIRERGIEYSYELARKNLNNLLFMIEWNEKCKINVFRMSSEIFPFATHPEFYKKYDIEQFRNKLQEIGNYAKSLGHRLTFHPGQFNQLTSLRDEVVDKTVVELDFHSKILDMMGIDKQGVMIIHGGGKAGGKSEALARLKKNYSKLSESSRSRLVLENCEMAYSIQDLLPISHELKIPIVIDYHHHNINAGNIKNKQELVDITNKVLEIWKYREITPLFHVSESKPGVTETDSITARRAHSDYVEKLPEALLETLKTNKIDLDVEAKMKEQAVFKLYEKYKLVVQDTFYKKYII